MSLRIAITTALPWIILPPIALLRVARSRSLDEESDALPDPAPSISLIVPARNEERNIGRCLRSVLDTSYPSLEVIVVDDHSHDNTARIARDFAALNERVRVLESPPLPTDWFGKQWACATGAAAAHGDLLLFIDADTWHARDLLPRALHAMGTRRADLLSVAGRQETHSFWERLVQPQVLWMLLARYGGTEGINRARHASSVIASGQFLLVRRAAYYAVGGHEAVRGKVAEDLALGQRFFKRGYRVAMVLGGDKLRTHMYASLSELVSGWGKNMYAGGIDAMPGGAAGRALFPVVLLIAPLMIVTPALALLLALVGLLGTSWLAWSIVCVASGVLWWGFIYRGFDQSAWYSLLHPVGGMVVLYIVARSIVRGRRVAWKGREYVTQ